MQQNALKKPKTPWTSQELEQKLGQLLMIGFESTALKPAEIKFIEAVDPAGVIYFRRNLDSPQQALDLSLQVWKTFKTPPFIGIDQEGGRVERLTKPFTHFPGNASLGQAYKKTGSSKLARQQVHAMCAELKSIGVNLDFSPVADIHSNPKNPIINDRAFDSGSKVVSNLVGITVDRFNHEHIVSCAKHFPGHGDTDLDSHLALPHVDTSLKTLFSRELKPFMRAIAYKVPMIMTAHVIYADIDPQRMATFSPFFLKSILRQRLGFQGIIASDDLEMHAVSKNKNLADAAIEALAAGVDVLMVCKSLDESQQIYDRIKKAFANKELDPEQLQSSIERVLRVKRRFIDKPPKQKLVSMSWEQHIYLSEKIEKVAKS